MPYCNPNPYMDVMGLLGMFFFDNHLWIMFFFGAPDLSSDRQFCRWFLQKNDSVGALYAKQLLGGLCQPLSLTSRRRIDGIFVQAFRI